MLEVLCFEQAATHDGTPGVKAWRRETDWLAPFATDAIRAGNEWQLIILSLKHEPGAEI